MSFIRHVRIMVTISSFAISNTANKIKRQKHLIRREDVVVLVYFLYGMHGHMRESPAKRA